MHIHRSGNVLCFLALGVVVGMPALAEEPEETIARCARIASIGDRILCLEKALREKQTETSDQSKIEEPADPGEVTIVEAPAEEPVMAAESIAEAAEIPEEKSTEAASSEVANAAAVQQPADVSDIGAEQVEARTMTREEREAALATATDLRVASYRLVPYERLVVELENGQVWRQIKGDVQRIRVDLTRNQTVDISETRFGGYQLRLNEIRRTIRVERVK